MSALPTPPYGWVVHDGPERTRIVGFDFSAMWPLTILMVGVSVLGFPSLRASVAYVAAATVGSALAACLRGFRLEIGPRGFILWRTWAGVPYWRARLPLGARVTLAGGFGDPDDRVVIERRSCSEDMTLGSSSTCAARHRAIADAQARWLAAENAKGPYR